MTENVYKTLSNKAKITSEMATDINKLYCLLALLLLLFLTCTAIGSQRPTGSSYRNQRPQ